MSGPSDRWSLAFLIGKLEALVLLLVGGAVAWFAIAGRYELLMNPRFRWLSVTGAGLVLIMGLALLLSRERGSAQGVGAFLLLIVIVGAGRPDVPTVRSRMNLLPELDIELPDQIDEARFTRTKLQGLFTAGEAPESDVVTMGAVKRLPETDERGGFLLMDSLMICCAADMFGIGFFVPVASVADYSDGELLIVCGRLERSDTPIQVGNFRFGNAVMTAVDEERLLRPEMIFPYDRMAGMPTVAGLMDSEMLSVFRDALRRTDLWEELDGDDEFTVFAPVNEAFEKLGDRTPLLSQPDRMRSLLANHIVRGRLVASDLYRRDRLETVGGTTIGVQVVNGKLLINGSRVLLQDTEARNGVVHYVYPLIIAEQPRPGPNTPPQKGSGRR